MNFLIPSIRSVTRFFAQLILVVAASFCVNVQAADSFVIKDIRIEGLQRVEPGTVFSYLPVQVGDTFTDEKSAEAIKALYSTGFFRDVQIQAQGSVLIVIVEERPTISRIEFTGMKEFDQEVLKNGYIRHLLKLGEITGVRLMSYHNLYFYVRLMEKIRAAIDADNYAQFKKQFLTDYQSELLNTV